MADYRSTLTGTQMDAALLDMAEHNSEAYAVGERNGIAVASDDVTYHNNARYYAQIASSQIVGDASSAVRWDTDQSEALTDAQKAQARANIMAGGSNPNLLDNPWFTVRQRGNGAFGSGRQYTADRWEKLSQGSITFNANGASISPTATTAFIELLQYSEPSVGSVLVNKTVTFSLMAQDGTVYSKVGVVPSAPASGATNFISLTIQTGISIGIYRRNTGDIMVDFMYNQAQTQVTFNIRAVKLEIGSVSTLANDAPPDYGEELTRCIYSTADPADTYANNGFGRSNRNLLDNPWFTVNQRGQSSYTSGYNADRWVSTSGATVTLNASGTLTWATSSTYREFKQKIANPSYYANGTYTVSVNVVSATGVPWIILHNGNSGEILRKSLTVGMNSVTFTTGDSGIGMFGVYNLASANISVGLKAVKLELGSVSTLANDAPPDYAEELLKCKRYFQRISGYLSYIGTGYCDNTTEAYFLCPLSVPLRSKVVTLSHTGVYLNSTNITAVTGLIILRDGNSVNDASIALKATASGLTAKAPALLQIRAENGYIDLSADL